jgi:preprotein translocase subunit SecG
MQTVIIMIHLIVVIALIGFVLLQKSEGGGLGTGGSAGGSGFLSSRGTANVLSRTTAILAAVFFATSLLLSVLAGMGRKPASIIQGNPAGPTAPASSQDNAPLSGGGGLLDTLRGGGAQPPASGPAPAAPAAPAAPPSGPQVPQSR